MPIAFGAFGGVLCERAGVINIAIEGQLLGRRVRRRRRRERHRHATLGLLAAPVAGCCSWLLLALFAIKYVVNQIIVGVVLNVLADRPHRLPVRRRAQAERRDAEHPAAARAVAIPLLSRDPVLGPVLFRQTVLVYLMYVAVVC